MKQVLQNLIRHKFTTLERIVNVLLLNASFIDNMGLMHGKMGICIFFFHLARKTKNKIFEDYSGELLDEIFTGINQKKQISWDFENGIAGIGWGIEYLVQNNFAEADTDEVLKTIDEQVCWRHLYASPSSVGLQNGLMAIGAYYLMRMKNKRRPGNSIVALTIKYILIQFIDEIERRLVEKEFINNILKGETGPLSIEWSLPLLFIILIDLHNLKLFNNKTDRVIYNLLERFKNQNNLPVFHSNRILLSEAFNKLEKSSGFENVNIKKLAQSLNEWIIVRVDDSVIKKELTYGNLSLNDNSIGTNWLYRNLSGLSVSPKGKYCALCKIDRFLYNALKGQDIICPATADRTKEFGLLNGLAGIGLQFMNKV